MIRTLHMRTQVSKCKRVVCELEWNANHLGKSQEKSATLMTFKMGKIDQWYYQTPQTHI